MKFTRTLLIPLLIAALSGSAYAAGDQTAPGASHGPTTVNPSASGHSGADSTGGPTGIGGTPNGTSAAGRGIQGSKQGSGGMQPRLDNGNSSGNATDPARRGTTNGTAQGL